MFFEKDRIIKLMQSNQLASPLSFKIDSPRIYSKTPNTQSLNSDLTIRDKLKLNMLSELSDNRSLTNRYLISTKNKPKQQKILFSKENKFIEESLKASKLYPSTDSLLQNINIQSPTSTFSEEFMKINQKFQSVKIDDQQKPTTLRKQSNSVIQIHNEEKSNERLFNLQVDKRSSTFRSTEKMKQMDEITLLDLKSQNTYLQQENTLLKSQLQTLQETSRHQNKLISKLKQNLSQLEQFNLQLKEKNDKNIQNIEKLNQELESELFIQCDLKQQLQFKDQELSKFIQIEQEIKNLEDFHLQTLTKIDLELKEQHYALRILNHQISCLTQLSILLSEKEEIPIEILFKYKQQPQFQQLTCQQDLIEGLLKTNSKLIKEQYDIIGRSFEKISYNFVQEFTTIMCKQ